MPERVIGLDLGSHAVRAADVALGAVPELRAFGQVGLPRGAVEHGEILDPGAVAASLRRLWRETRLRNRRVRVGLANVRTIVRQVEMPAMPEADLRSALEFQAGEFIPLPMEETQLDFSILETFTGEDGEEMVRVLIAAAHRDVVENALTAVREAGLQAVGLDLVPFALVRALGELPVPGEEPSAGAGSAQAIVSVGSGVTVVVVHEDGVPRFVRIVASGGDDLTDAVASGLDLPFEEAEVLKRSLGGAVEGAAEARAAIEAPLATLVNEIRGSVDFYASQPEARPVERVLVTGGAALLDGFVDRLAGVLPAPAALADITGRLRIGDIGFGPDEISALQPYLAVPVGLALGGARGVRYRIDLLPGRERRVLAAGRVTAAGAAGLGALAVVLAALWVGRAGQVSDALDRLEAQQTLNAQLQAKITQLDDARQLQTDTDAARQLVASVLDTDVSWSRMLQEIARVIPDDVWLEGFNGAIQTATEAGGAPQGVAGTVTFTAIGSDFPSTAAWLQRLATVPSFTAPWVNQATRGTVTELGATVDAVNFAATANLTEQARSERSRAAREKAGIRATSGTGGGTSCTTTTTGATGSTGSTSTTGGAP